MKFYTLFITMLCIVKGGAVELDSKHTSDMIKSYEGFFKEAFAQGYESFKVQKDSRSGLHYIDFCAYPPDRSLPFGALSNGRFKGEKIKDLPFTCDESSGAKKYFIQNADIKASYLAIKKLPIASFLPELIPNNTELSVAHGKITSVWQNSNQNRGVERLWILYRNNLLQSCNIVFTRNGKNTEVILQYLNMPNIQ